jgi:hypothetical protein
MVISKVAFEATLESGVSGTTGTSSPMDQELNINGPLMVDLFNLSDTPLGKFSLSKGTYSEIEIRAYGTTAEAGRNPVFNLAGTYTDASGQSWPIMVNITDDMVLSAEKMNVTVNRDIPDFSPVIRVYLDKLFTNVLPSLLEDPQITDGTIIISSTSNPEVYQIILKNFQKPMEWEFSGPMSS